MQPPFRPSNAIPAYRRTKIRRLITWLPVGFWMVFIFYWSAQSALPGFGQSFLDLLLKKGAHLAVFAVLAVLAYRAARADFSGPAALLTAGLIAIGYGALDEFHQLLVAGRNAVLLDVFIDAAGALLALNLLSRARHDFFAPVVAPHPPSRGKAGESDDLG
ncbi:MAG: VanZ family protein [Chloroflexota bacterium]|jgi:VanZ family protein|nr:VanZ family protein [Chloroflexota bacterium]MDP6507894.1 VanZ family protein [Chloroflexota bacterium]MDP6757523.1 VanZ family protein [Chloroflexota bacterium]